MRRYLLGAVAAAITAHPMASLPLPVEQTGRDRVIGVVGRIAATGCAVDAQPARVGIGHRAPTLRTNRGAPVQVRQRTGRVHGRCLPRRECFTSQRPVGTEAVPDSLFRTPPFLGR